jgi:hypothetical protein
VKPWTLTMSCPLCGGAVEKINETRHETRKSGACTMLLVILKCGECTNEWELETRLARHSRPNYRWEDEHRLVLR